jgi:hypothetical protein
MSNCGCAEKPTEPNAVRCPASGHVGTGVDLQTVKALLTEAALGRLKVTNYRFCPDPACQVVYFEAAGMAFRTNDVRVPVWQKEPFGARTLCYCFGESEATIRDELEGAGRSRAAERVREHIAAGRCACEIRNPRGTCCLGDVLIAEKLWSLRLGSDAEAQSGMGNGTRNAADNR